MELGEGALGLCRLPGADPGSLVGWGGPKDPALASGAWGCLQRPFWTGLRGKEAAPSTRERQQEGGGSGLVAEGCESSRRPAAAWWGWGAPTEAAACSPSSVSPSVGLAPGCPVHILSQPLSLGEAIGATVRGSVCHQGVGPGAESRCAWHVAVPGPGRWCGCAHR